MKGLVLILATCLFGFAAHQWLPWWVIAAVPMVLSAALGLHALTSFLAGFSGAFLLWAGMAFWLHQSGDGLLADRMGMLLGGLPAEGMIAITGIIGGLLGGFGALTGTLGIQMLKSKNRR